MGAKPVYIWDYDIDEDQLKQILAGRLALGRHDRQWALLRLFEYAPYEDVVRLVGFPQIVEWWPKLRKKMRSQSRKRGFDFLVEYLPAHHPELLHG